MKISIIIATYNDPFLKQCLDSIYGSRGIDFEVIVIDDCSTSVDVKNITNEYPKCKTFIFEKNKGPAVARNFGVKQATGEIIFFIDSDTQLYSDTLKKIITRFENEPTLQGITIVWSDESIKGGFFNKFKAIETNYLYKNVYNTCFGSNGSAIYKNLFLKQGGFDEGFKTADAEDFHIGFKFLTKNYNIVLDRNITMKHCFLDRFFFRGMKKYCKRAFLKAMVLGQTKDRTETSFNSKKFKMMCFFSVFIFILIILSLIIKLLIWAGITFYAVFFWINRKLYLSFYRKYGLIFAFKSIILHYFYVLITSISGIFGLIYAYVFKGKNSL